MGKIPEGWLPYSPIGNQVPGTRFIAFKVPLREAFVDKLKAEDRFTVNILLDKIPDLGLVIDLTHTTKYYNKREFLDRGVDYVKIQTPGQTVPPQHLVERFFEVVDYYLDTHKNDNTLIGVHCTHGVNRTGYMLCRYLIQRLGYTFTEAVEAVGRARGHMIERSPYLASLQANRESVKKKTALRCIEESKTKTAKKEEAAPKKEDVQQHRPISKDGGLRGERGDYRASPTRAAMAPPGRGNRRMRSRSPLQPVRGRASPIPTRDRTPPMHPLRERPSPPRYERQMGVPSRERAAPPGLRERLPPAMARGRTPPPPVVSSRSPPLMPLGRTQPSMSRGRTPPPMSRGRPSPPPMPRGRTPPMSRGRSPPMSRGRSPPMTRGRTPPPPMKRGRSPPPMSRGRSPPPTSRGRSPPPQLRGRTPPPPYRGRSPPPTMHMSHRSPPPAMIRGRSPGRQQGRARSPGLEMMGRMPSSSTRGRSPPPHSRGRSPPPSMMRASPPLDIPNRSPHYRSGRSPPPRSRSPLRGRSPGRSMRGRPSPMYGRDHSPGHPPVALPRSSSPSLVHGHSSRREQIPTGRGRSPPPVRGRSPIPSRRERTPPMMPARRLHSPDYRRNEPPIDRHYEERPIYEDRRGVEDPPRDYNERYPASNSYSNERGYGTPTEYYPDRYEKPRRERSVSPRRHHTYYPNQREELNIRPEYSPPRDTKRRRKSTPVIELREKVRRSSPPSGYMNSRDDFKKDKREYSSVKWDHLKDKEGPDCREILNEKRSMRDNYGESHHLAYPEGQKFPPSNTDLREALEEEKRRRHGHVESHGYHSEDMVMDGRTMIHEEYSSHGYSYMGEGDVEHVRSRQDYTGGPGGYDVPVVHSDNPRHPGYPEHNSYPPVTVINHQPKDDFVKPREEEFRKPRGRRGKQRVFDRLSRGGGRNRGGGGYRP